MALFCAKIFGPIKDYECLCGKYKRLKHRGVICEKCGVEVTLSKVRRERMGHIELACPVAHIWFLKSLPSRMGLILDMTLRDIERVLYFEAYVIVDPGMTPLERSTLLSEEAYLNAVEQYGDEFDARMGAEAVRDLLKAINLEEEATKLREELAGTTSETKIKKFRQAPQGDRGVPAFRQQAGMDGARNPAGAAAGAASAGAARRRPFCHLGSERSVSPRDQPQQPSQAPARPQRARYHRAQRKAHAAGSGGRVARQRPPRQGHHRRQQAPAEVAGRHDQRQAGPLPPEPARQARRLLRPFRDRGRSRRSSCTSAACRRKWRSSCSSRSSFSKLESKGLATTIKLAKKMVEQASPEVWDILEEVIREHPVMLNRAPTLHRLGIQAFEPVLIEGKAIQLHPLVCAAYNADFDGDQMAVHIPLSLEAQLEARALMMSTNNVLSPANGDPIIVPSQDIVLGLYYMTRSRINDKGEGKAFSDISEVHRAYETRQVSLNAHVKVRIREVQLKADSASTETLKLYETTVGRALLSEILPEGLSFELINRDLKKKAISELINACYRRIGLKATVIFADQLMYTGFAYAARAGISIGVDDMVAPAEKAGIIAESEAEVKAIQSQYSSGLLTDGERYNKVVDIWTRTSEKVAKTMMDKLGKEEVTDAKGNKVMQDSFNSIFMMADSGARGRPPRSASSPACAA